MIVLCYHELTEIPETPWELHPDVFRQHMNELSRRRYRSVFIPYSAEQNDPRDVAVTFDDGRKGCWAAEMILREMGWGATYYLTSGFLAGTHKPGRDCPNGFLSRNDMCDLDMTSMLGAHSVSHTPFNNLSTIEIMREMSASKDYVANVSRCGCQDFATPHGFWSEEVAEIAEILGYRTLVTTEFGANKDFNPYRIQRWEVRNPCPLDEFKRTMDQLESML